MRGGDRTPSKVQTPQMLGAGAWFLWQFANKWLNIAILWELLLLTALVYVPFLHQLFGTFSLTVVDWLVVIGLAASVTPVLELVKWLEQRGWFGGRVSQTTWTFDQEKL